MHTDKCPCTPSRHAIAGKSAPTGRFNPSGNTPGWMLGISFGERVKKHGRRAMGFTAIDPAGFIREFVRAEPVEALPFDRSTGSRSGRTVIMFNSYRINKD